MIESFIIFTLFLFSILVLTIILMIFLGIITNILCKKFGVNKFFRLILCDILSWHFVDNSKCYKREFNNPNIFDINIHNKCLLCNKEVTLDSQGNWF